MPETEILALALGFDVGNLSWLICVWGGGRLPFDGFETVRGGAGLEETG